jgi:phenylacetate-CoA ligase
MSVFDAAQAFHKTLLQTQIAAPHLLQSFQRQELAKLLRHAHATVPFYRDQGRLRPLFRPDGSIAWDEWANLPVLTRRQAQAAVEQLKPDAIPREAGEITSHVTSGSTGISFRHDRVELQWIADCAAGERFFTWHQFDRRATYAKIKSGGGSGHQNRDGLTLGPWNVLEPASVTHFLDAIAPGDVQVSWLHKINPVYLESFPNLARLLIDAIGTRPADFRLQSFVSVGEVLREETRRRFSEFGVKCRDVYSAMEVGAIAHECAHCGRLHVSSELCLVEILKDDESPAADGEEGRVVVTPLYAFATPLIRYDLSDRASMIQNDRSCKIRLPVLQSIVGRDRDAFVLRDGTRRWLPLRVGLSAALNYRQFQIVQTAVGRVEIRIVSDAPQPVKSLAKAQSIISEWMTEPVDVNVAVVDSILPDRNGKLQDVVSLLADQ